MKTISNTLARPYRGLARTILLSIGLAALFADSSPAQTAKYGAREQVYVRTKSGAFSGPVRQGRVISARSENLGNGNSRILYYLRADEKNFVAPEEYVRSVAEHDAGQVPPEHPNPRTELTDLINKQRTARYALDTDPILQTAAQDYAEHIAQNYPAGRAVGDEADGQTPVERVKAAFTSAGQSYAYGDDRGDNVAQILGYGAPNAVVAMYGKVIGWEDSEQMHWKIINSIGWTRVGIGVAAYPDQPDQNAWVVLFAAEVETPGELYPNGPLSVVGNLTKGRDDTYDFVMEDGTSYAIQMYPMPTIDQPGFWTVLSLTDPQGNLVASEDSRVEGFTSQLTYTARASGLQRIVASSSNKTGSGAYRLTASLSAALNREISERWYKVRLNSGEQYSFSTKPVAATPFAAPTMLETRLELYDAEKQKVPYNVVLGENLYGVRFTPRETGTYLIKCYQPGGIQPAGRFTLSVESTPAGPRVQQPSELAILQRTIPGSTWIYTWRGQEFDVSFGDAGDVLLPETWRGARWQVVGPKDVILDANGDRMSLRFDDELRSFTTKDWDGTPATGQRKEIIR